MRLIKPVAFTQGDRSGCVLTISGAPVALQVVRAPDPVDAGVERLALALDLDPAGRLPKRVPLVMEWKWSTS